MAGGAALGATVGIILESVIGWRLLFLGVAIAATVVLVFLLPYRSLLGGPVPEPHASLREVFAAYRGLLWDRRGFELMLTCSGMRSSTQECTLGLAFTFPSTTA
jgi:predicted MFS family arabinose efflux permease